MECKHLNLVLLVENKSQKVRCKKCHLTIKTDELQNGYCPECFERSGQKIYDFENEDIKKSGDITYRCEDCGEKIKV